MFTFLIGLSFLLIPPSLFSNAPVHLIDFEVRMNGEKALLRWSTQSESNCDYFQIQKSKDKHVWLDVGVADGAGNSNDLVHYSFADNDTWPGQSSYRLIQFNENGDFYILASEEINLANVQEFEVYPNPANNLLTVRADSDLVAVKFQLLDLAGNPVMTNRKKLGNKLEMNTSEVPNGIYILQSSFGNYKSSKKVIISHNR